MARSLIGLGANLADRVLALDRAVELLRANPRLQSVVVSSWHSTAPVGGPPGQGDFLDGAAVFDSDLSPREVVEELRAIELLLGRERRQRWGARTLDLDLLLHGDSIVNEPDLVVPHPRMATRHFVLAPAAEIAPEMLHPEIGWTVRELLAHLHDALPYVAIVGLPGIGKTRLATEIAKRLHGHCATTPATGPAFSSEIEWIRNRAKLLAKDALRADQAPWISDFWLGQSLAYAKMDSKENPFDAARTELARIQGDVAEADLLVILESPRVAGDDSDARLQAELVRQATGLGRGPWLRLDAGDPQLAFNEIVAAIQAMKP